MRERLHRGPGQCLCLLKRCMRDAEIKFKHDSCIGCAGCEYCISTVLVCACLVVLRYTLHMCPQGQEQLVLRSITCMRVRDLH